MTDPDARREVTAAFAEFAAVGEQPIIVHGGGPYIAKALEQEGLESRFVRGLRVTTKESINLIERELTLLNKYLSQAVGNAIGLTGRDAQLIKAEPFDAELGLVGRVTSINTDLLQSLLAQSITPVLTCLAASETGALLNVNADEVAGAVAGALKIPILFLSNVAGVLDNSEDKTSLLRELSAADIKKRIQDGRIAGGMIPKVEAALYALERGAAYAVIANGESAEAVRRAQALKGGTRIVA